MNVQNALINVRVNMLTNILHACTAIKEMTHGKIFI